MSNDPVWDDLNRRLATGQPVDRIAGIDMVPSPIPDFARVPEEPALPETDAERSETVNADIMSRVCQASVAELLRRVRGIPLEGPYNVRNLVTVTAQELEVAVNRYLSIERKFRKSR